MEVMAGLIFLVTIIERLFELVISKRNLKWSLERGGREFGREHYSWMVGLHVCFLSSIFREYYYFENNLPHVVRWSSCFLAMVFQILRWWIIHTLGHQWNTRVIVVPGFKRVLTGPYRYFRHPNYIVVMAETLVLPLVFGAWRTGIIFVCLNAMMLRVRILTEDKALRVLD